MFLTLGVKVTYIADLEDLLQVVITTQQTSDKVI
jgi:hypothetical protein